ncbi:hypothetical protein BZA77DRAFT_355490 [Pyronema omphalodes]|nr:hypothetical protein BZA77DRAFT_355490 [Pyronema omphalodes]
MSTAPNHNLHPLRFVTSCHKPKPTERHINIAVLGPSKSGKTQFINTICGGIYSRYHQPTNVSQAQGFFKDHSAIKFTFWEWRNTKFFFEKPGKLDLIIIVFPLIGPEGHQFSVLTYVEAYAYTIRTSAKGIPILLLGTMAGEAPRELGFRYPDYEYIEKTTVEQLGFELMGEMELNVSYLEYSARKGIGRHEFLTMLNNMIAIENWFQLPDWFSLVKEKLRNMNKK